MTLESFFPILVQVTLALVIAVGVIAASHLFGQRIRKLSRFKGTPYECGVPSEGITHYALFGEVLCHCDAFYSI